MEAIISNLCHNSVPFFCPGLSFFSNQLYMQTLRAMPIVDLETPTLCLVGAPNVGKSSLVRILSTGKPEVCTISNDKYHMHFCRISFI